MRYSNPQDRWLVWKQAEKSFVRIAVNNELFSSDDSPPRLSIEPTENASQVRTPPGQTVGFDHRKRIPGYPWLAWLVILGLTLFVMSGNFFPATPDAETELTKGEFLGAVFIGKMAVGLTNLSPGLAQNGDQAEMIQELNQGTIEQRLCYVILSNELENPEIALSNLKSLKDKIKAAGVELQPDQIRAERIIRTTLQQLKEKQPATPSKSDQEFIEELLPWCGKLLVSSTLPDSEMRKRMISRAKASVLFLSGFVLLGLIFFIVGIVLFFIFASKVLLGQLPYRVIDDSKYGSVYIETYAIWFLLFISLSIAAAFSGAEGMGVAVTSLMMLVPLSALFWPIFRGVPTGEMLDDLGLRLRNPLVEMIMGFLAYLALLPVMLAGFICTLILIVIMGLIQSNPEVSEFAPNGISHPIVNGAFGSDAIVTILTLFFIASVLAPLTEEIMFRGVLYRSLRDQTRRSSRIISVLLAALISSLIFAAIHPQGIVGIPVLTTLAFGFCMVRQWRGSLVAPITMHAIHNGLTLCILVPVIL